MQPPATSQAPVNGRLAEASVRAAHPPPGVSPLDLVSAVVLTRDAIQLTGWSAALRANTVLSSLPLSSVGAVHAQPLLLRPRLRIVARDGSTVVLYGRGRALAAVADAYARLVDPSARPTLRNPVSRAIAGVGTLGVLAAAATLLFIATIALATVLVVRLRPDMVETADQRAPGDLQVGDCFFTPADVPPGGVVTAVDVVPCDSPHEAEVIAVKEYPETRVDGYPGDAAVEYVAATECEQHFRAFMGESPGGEFDLLTISPSEEGWHNGDREVLCAAIRTDGDPINDPLEELRQVTRAPLQRLRSAGAA